VLNYITAYQMLHRSVKARPGQRMLIHGAAGGVGSAMLQLAKLAGVEMYGTCSVQAAAVVRELGGIPIDYKNADFVKEIHRLTGDGVDAVFDGIGGDNLWRSRDALREGGRVVTYGFQSKMRGGRMASGIGGRHPIRESAELGWFIVRNWFKPGRKSMVPYSIQWLMRFKPVWFRSDLLTLLDLLQQGRIKPLIAQRLPLKEARRAHEMLGEGGVLGKIVLVPANSTKFPITTASRRSCRFQGPQSIALERFPLGLNRDSQGARKGGVLAGQDLARRASPSQRRQSTRRRRGECQAYPPSYFPAQK
jgi:NADPH2:quinone reductase